MRIIVDTNIVFSALLNSNSKICKILMHSKEHFQFFSCSFLKKEINKHRNKLLKLTKLNTEQLIELEELVTKHIEFIDENLIPKEILTQTELQLINIDVNDTVFVALTTYLEGRLWTGDLQLHKGLKAKQYKNVILTSELSLLLDDLEH